MLRHGRRCIAVLQKIGLPDAAAAAVMLLACRPVDEKRRQQQQQWAQQQRTQTGVHALSQMPHSRAISKLQIIACC